MCVFFLYSIFFLVVVFLPVFFFCVAGGGASLRTNFFLLLNVVSLASLMWFFSVVVLLLVWFHFSWLSVLVRECCLCSFCFVDHQNHRSANVQPQSPTAAISAYEETLLQSACKEDVVRLAENHIHLLFFWVQLHTTTQP